MENFLRTFAKETGGEFIEGQYWHSDKVSLPYKETIIVFDNYTYYTTSGGNSYTKLYTRVIAPFISNYNFTFELYKTGYISNFLKIFGAQDIKIGDTEFDKAYTIKSSNELKVKSLLSDKFIRRQIQKIPKLNLQISNQKGIWEEELPENHYELGFFTEDEIKDINTFLQINELMQLVLTHLKDINVIQN